MGGPRQTIPFRRAATVALAFAAGLAIAFVDSSRGWDSTGITAGALLLAAGVAAFQGRSRPWLWIALIGLPTPVIEISGRTSTGAFLALVFAGVGGTVGWALGRAG